MQSRLAEYTPKTEIAPTPTPKSTMLNLGANSFSVSEAGAVNVVTDSNNSDIFQNSGQVGIMGNVTGNVIIFQLTVDRASVEEVCRMVSGLLINAHSLEVTR